MAASSGRGLEEQLAEAGNKLLKPPSSVDELLPLLDEAESFLTKVEQSPAKSMHDALSPMIKALVADELLRHSDVDVKVALASCLSEITRITAPDAPYDDEKMKVVFQLIVSSFENLYDESSRSFSKRAMILETVSKVRLCVVMLDLECDALIFDMFQHFLKAIREYHPDNIFSSMESIMILVLEESEDISMELVTKLLDSVKKENEEIKPIGKRLAESVVVNCASKLKPYITHAVKSLGISLDEYSEVLSSILQGTPVAAEHNNDTLKELSCVESKLASSAERAQETQTVENKASTVSSDELGQMAVDTKQEACSKDENQAVNTSPKSVTSSGVNGGNSVETESLAKLGDHGPNQTDIAKLTPKSDTDDSQANSSMKSEPDKSEHSAKEQGGKSKSQTNSAESLDQTPDPDNTDKETEKLPDSQRSERDVHGSLVENSPENHPDEQKSKGEDIDSLPADNTTDEAAKLLDENKTSAQVSPHKTSEDEAANVASSHPSQSLPDEIHEEEEPTQPKEDDDLVQEESVSAEIASKKPSDGTSDSEAQPQEDPGIRVQTETSHEEEAGTMSDAEAKDIKQRGEKAETNITEGGSSMRKKNNTKRRGRGKANMDIDVPKSSAKDDSNKMSSQESPQRSAEDDGKEGSQRKNTKRKRPLGKEKVPDIAYDESLVGSKVKVWWPLDSVFYEGVVASYDPVKKKHTVLYTDGDEEVLNLRKERWEIVGEHLMGESDLDEPSSPDASAEMPKKKKTRRQAETSKHDSGGSKAKGTATKSGRKSKDDAIVEPKSKDRGLKSGGKSKDVTSNKLKNDSEKGLGKLKDVISSSSPRSKSKTDISPKTASKSQQDTVTKSIPRSKGKAPQSGGKPSANGGTGKGKSMSKGKETGDVKEKSTEVAKTPDSGKGKVSGASKEQETESKIGKKRKRK
ncbi:PREDICTED: uncharacterized protein LOC109178882 isoform X2 [Ipomoea nil]|uniref:uncharacterized protein LOC109178882 isoform X2 n=1 Tax=Ipomoea nil TaxID=35883 RepID=UPI000901D90E|nr:PREDICTED: uncharacterized protein LOC109178882 isoform X2 [Ipomoea nil]